MKKYDIIVLGTGVGLAFVETALHMNLKCAVVEPLKFGGTCLTRGCIPSKVLTTAADYIMSSKDAKVTGVSLKTEDIDLDRIFERMHRQIDNSNDIEQSLLKAQGLDVFKGYGEFLDNKTLKVRYKDGTYSDSITAETIVVAVGARTYIPDIDGLEETGYYTSERFFGNKNISDAVKSIKDIAIIGAGAIGLEFSHFFNAIGMNVTLLGSKNRILPKEEPEVSEFVKVNIKRTGVKVLLNSDVKECRIEGDKKKLHVLDTSSGNKREVICDEIFVCPGVRSNSDLVKIENTDVATDDRGYIITDKYLKTNIDGIWALGDINGKYQFRHKANYEADICAFNIFNDKNKLREASYDAVPWAVFTYPEVAHLGKTLEQALEEYDGVFVAQKNYSSIAKGFALGYEYKAPNDGFVKLIVSKDMQIVGAHIVGNQASVLIQSYAYLMSAKTILPLSESMVIHPALSEVAAWVISELEWVAS